MKQVFFEETILSRLKVGVLFNPYRRNYFYIKKIFSLSVWANLLFINLFMACENRKDCWEVEDLFSGFTLTREATDSVVAHYPDKFTYSDTLKVGYTVKYKCKIARSLECRFKLNFNSMEAGCILDPDTKELSYVALTPVSNNVSIDITDPWGRKKTVTINFTGKSNVAPMATVDVGQRFIASGYEITIDASKSCDPDAKFGGKVVTYEYVIGNQTIQNSSPVFKDVLTSIGKDSVKVRVKDNDEAWSKQLSVFFNVGLTDAQNNIYPVVVLGNQIWMAENLRTTKYNNGTTIPLDTSSANWGSLTAPAYCWYNNDSATYKKAYGALYNWYAVNTNKLCPTGWHVPTAIDWALLITYLGGENIAGGKLKEAGTLHWNSPNAGATNETGFSALPGSGRALDGTFNNIGKYGFWWATDAEVFTMDYRFASANHNVYNTNFGYGVRCLKD